MTPPTDSEVEAMEWFEKPGTKSPYPEAWELAFRQGKVLAAALRASQEQMRQEQTKHEPEWASKALSDMEAEVRLLREQLRQVQADAECERMRLAACGTAALGYFEDCAEEYKSASLNDVLRLKARAEAAEAQVERLECLLKERKENIESAQHWKEQAAEWCEKWTDAGHEIVKLKAAEAVARIAVKVIDASFDDPGDAVSWGNVVNDWQAISQPAEENENSNA